MNGVMTLITITDKLKYARQSELQVQAELEQVERLHRILRLPNRSAEYVERLLEKLASLERRLNNSIDLVVDRKNEALNILDNLEGDERTVLFQYYILGKNWEKISEEMYMSDRNVYNLRKKAMDKLSAIYLNGMPDTEKRRSGNNTIMATPHN